MGDDHGRPLRLDTDAAPADPNLPAFLARPEGTSVYHGFPVLEDVEVDGFSLGMITDWEVEQTDRGDAFVVAPDGSRAGLDWEVHAERKVEQVMKPDDGRWGVWYVTFPNPMSSRDNARQNLAAVLSDLRSHWESWAQRGSS